MTDRKNNSPSSLPVNTVNPVERQVEPLLDLLAAQCADLEALLLLARRETRAAEDLNFSEVMRVVEERATLGGRLEVYHRQIAELRTRCGDVSLAPILGGEIARQTLRLAADIQAQDARTRPLLLQAQSETRRELTQLTQNRRGVGAYLRDGATAIPVACDQRV
jgi:hypothetical protein